MPKAHQLRIPRPRNEWIIFLSEFCEGRNGPVSSGERASQAASRRWKAMTEEEKIVYVGKAQIELEEHRLKYPGYVYKPARRAGSRSGSRKKKGKRASKMARVQEALGDGKASKTKKARIPRPRNEWIIFLTDFCEGRKGVVSSGERASQAASRRWNAMTGAEKAVYVGKAQIELEEHRRKYPGYVYDPARRARSGGRGRRKNGERTSKAARMKEVHGDGEAQCSGYGVSIPSSASSQKDAMPGLFSPYESEFAILQTKSASEACQSSSLGSRDNFPSTELFTEGTTDNTVSSPILSTPMTFRSYSNLSNDNVEKWLGDDQYFEDQARYSSRYFV
ncbi:hypothetical protein V5O48_003800 [Marasmius crinis-equi]|uniref:HMG box domain-containing protein n=1 Tax=Marasmius crinis-equi TaxID=585013 RepID=A0ABR3FRU7_9AGAR